jgi:hypothetical protein
VTGRAGSSVRFGRRVIAAVVGVWGEGWVESGRGGCEGAAMADGAGCEAGAGGEQPGSKGELRE